MRMIDSNANVHQLAQQHDEMERRRIQAWRKTRALHVVVDNLAPVPGRRLRGIEIVERALAASEREGPTGGDAA